MGTITSANSVFLMTIPGLFAAPQPLQGYSADDAFTTDAVEPVEHVMGVDGKFSAGWVPTATAMNIAIMPDSSSCDLFETWDAAQKSVKEVYFATAAITLVSVGRGYILTDGVLASMPRIAPARKVLGARTFRIVWGDIKPAPI